MFQYQHANFDYEPYPIGLVKPILDESLYRELLASFPDIGFFKLNTQYGGKEALKYSLSERNHPEKYEAFLHRNPAWKCFRDWIKSPDFIRDTLDMLLSHQIDLGLLNGDGKRKSSSWLKRLWKGESREPALTGRFEFSILPANGGSFHPHTDAPGKIVTLILSMVGETEWDPAWGGGTEVMKPRDPRKTYNWLNRYLDFGEVETLRTYEFQPNQAVVFIKTFNSLHAVRPLKGQQNADQFRRTITINIEQKR